jgi:exosortase D (VPLPA-CTERM-specific)
LVFMLPLPGILTSALTLPLQLISSHLAALLLRLMGIHLVLQGNLIDLGVRQLQVAAACSGLRYILSLMALGIIYCYFYQCQIWKAGLLLISLIPAAIIANAIRVAAMGIFPALMQGFWHEFSGWLIFLFCFAFLALFNGFLDWLSPQIESTPTSVPKEDPVQPSGFLKLSLKPYLYIAMSIIILGGITIHRISEPSPVTLLQSFNHFPLHLGAWQGNRTYIPSKIFEATDADSYFDAEYTSTANQPVSLYIAHYEKQATAGGLGHNPAACMTGSGWHPVKSGIKEIAPGLSVNYLLLTKQGSTTPILVYYWNIHQGRWVALSSARIYKLFTIYNYLRIPRTDWALVRLITPVDSNIDRANGRLVSFARLLIPVIPHFIKN